MTDAGMNETHKRAQMIAEEVFPGRWTQNEHGNLRATASDGQPVGFNINAKGIYIYLEDNLPYLGGDAKNHVSDTVNQALREQRESQHIEVRVKSRFEHSVTALRGLLSSNAGRYARALEVRHAEIERYHQQLAELNQLMKTLGGRQNEIMRDRNSFELAGVRGELRRNSKTYTMTIDNIDVHTVERIAELLRGNAAKKVNPIPTATEVGHHA